MKRKFFYLAIAVLAFGIGTFFALDFYSQKTENQIFLQSKTINIASVQILQTELQSPNTDSRINFDDLKIKGIGLSSFQIDLQKTFGKPKKIRNNGNSYNCSDEDSKTLFFQDLLVDITHLSDSKKYQINKIEISSSKYLLDSGVKIGDDISNVFSKFGKGYHQNKDSDIDNYHFMVVDKNDVSNDGGVATFSFRDGKLVKIRWNYNFC
jgi:hypothetical protein